MINRKEKIKRMKQRKAQITKKRKMRKGEKTALTLGL